MRGGSNNLCESIRRAHIHPGMGFRNQKGKSKIKRFFSEKRMAARARKTLTSNMDLSSVEVGESGSLMEDEDQ
jgi:hypothetical protein